MDKSDSLSFSTGDENHSVVDLTSNKYAGNFCSMCYVSVTSCCCVSVTFCLKVV